MTLFEFDSQFRERATICRIFEMLPLFAPLADGHVFKWFALNIPMDLGTGGRFTSDMDIVACLRPKPALRGPEFYRTWEVKVALLCKDGSARSLKSGKTRGLINQMRAYREFGSPDVSLLDVYICEPGFMNRNVFPPEPARTTIVARMDELKKNGFGYQLLPFEHGKDGNTDTGLMAYPRLTQYGLPSTHFKLLPVTWTQPREGFSRLMAQLNTCYENELDQIAVGKGFVAVVFCRQCSQLGLTRMKEANLCPHCRADLLVQ
jgi:hypothetical protein